MAKGKTEQRPGTGPFWFNDNKKNPQAPDYTGFIIMDEDVKAGDEIKLCGWRKKTNRGSVINLKINRWTPKGGEEKFPKEVGDDEDIPF